MIREVDLVSYLPLFVAGYKEINITLAAENPEFALLWEAADRVLKNEFVATADESGIERFEKILHIFPETNDTLEIRRLRVQTQWFTALPYTWRMFIQKIMEICGTTYPVSIVREGSYLIKLEAGLELQWQIEGLIDVVERMLPCNMGIAIKNALPLDLETSAPTIKHDWFGYRVEYRGGIIADLGKVECTRLDVKMAFYFWGMYLLDGRWRLDGSVRLCQRPIRVLNTGVVIGAVKARNCERVNVEVTIRKDLWYLDGTTKLDGSRKLDAEVREEEL